VYDYTGVLISP